jgi:hypothetical protein
MVKSASNRRYMEFAEYTKIQTGLATNIESFLMMKDLREK